MDDTAPEVKELYRALLMKLSGEERFIRGALMFDAVRDVVLASFPEGLTPAERRRRLYERMYGERLPPDFLPPST